MHLWILPANGLLSLSTSCFPAPLNYIHENDNVPDNDCVKIEHKTLWR